MGRIEVDLDRYGKIARASCLADYLELLALSGHVCTYAQLADLIADRWGMRRQIMLFPGESGEVAEEYVDSTWTCLEERAVSLGDLYPFDLDRVRVRLKSGFDLRSSSYVALLCLTAAHAYEIDSPHNVEQLFEEVVASGLEGLGLGVARFGAINRANGFDFVKSLNALGAEMKIPVDHLAASRHAAANDSGLDVLCHLDWQDTRPGRWFFLGQVTCSASQRWSTKIAELKIPRWQKFLTELVAPKAFLAVPHYVDTRAYYEFVEGDATALVDRSRLVLQLKVLDRALADVVDAVMASEIETIDV